MDCRVLVFVVVASECIKLCAVNQRVIILHMCCATVNRHEESVFGYDVSFTHTYVLCIYMVCAFSQYQPTLGVCILIV